MRRLRSGKSWALLEAPLSSNSWLAGEALSAADLVAFPMLMQLERAVAREEAKPMGLDLHPFDTYFPCIAAWRGPGSRRYPASGMLTRRIGRRTDEALVGFFHHQPQGVNHARHEEKDRENNVQPKNASQAQPSERPRREEEIAQG